MKCEKYSWDVVVAGAWNTAILTPNGIGQRVYGVAEGDVIEVDIPVNVSAPPLVRSGNQTVTVTADRLTVSPSETRYALLQESMTLAKNPILSLRETPLRAAGINMRFFFSQVNEKFSAFLGSQFDEYLTEAGKEIESKRCRRSIEFGDGVLNIDVFENNPGDGAIMFNFHRSSDNVDDLLAWLDNRVLTFAEFVEPFCDFLEADIEKEGLQNVNDAEQEANA